MSDESLVQVVARRWCKWPTAEGPCVAHVARARELVSDLRLAGVDVTSPVDRLRKAGWTECGTCGGSGKVASSCSDQCDYEVACPVCVAGRVPPDGMVEAAARWAHTEMGRRSGVGLTWEVAYPEEQADYMRIARSMLVAAARWEAPGE